MISMNLLYLIGLIIVIISFFSPLNHRSLIFLVLSVAQIGVGWFFVWHPVGLVFVENCFNLVGVQLNSVGFVNPILIWSSILVFFVGNALNFLSIGA